MPDPIHQFDIFPLQNIELFGYDISFTNSSLFMVAAVVLIAGFLTFAVGGRSLVPTKMQSLAEIAYEFIHNMIRDSMGKEGLKYFPYVFTIFIFIFTLNMLGMLPWVGFTVTSHLIITVALALLVFFSVIIIGLARNGLGFFKIFVPSGVPLTALVLVVPIEVISFFSRPLSHSMRLFANMLAGHIAMKVFAGFIVMLIGAGAAYSLGGILPFIMTVGLTALEILVAFLQAYVFTMLTCMYLNDALHPGH